MRLGKKPYVDDELVIKVRAVRDLTRRVKEMARAMNNNWLRQCVLEWRLVRRCDAYGCKALKDACLEVSVLRLNLELAAAQRDARRYIVIGEEKVK